MCHFKLIQSQSKGEHIGLGRLNLQEEVMDNQCIGQFVDGISHENEYCFLYSCVRLPAKRSNLLASADHFDGTVPAIVHVNHVIGCQFHPEKSGMAGLRLLSNFCNIR